MLDVAKCKFHVNWCGVLYCVLVPHSRFSKVSHGDIACIDLWLQRGWTLDVTQLCGKSEQFLKSKLFTLKLNSEA
jgi:hypothetical protein